MTQEKKFTLTEALLIPPVVGTMFAGMFIVLLPLSLLRNYVLVALWNWFVPPYFHLQPISFWLMYALGIIFGSFKSVPAKSNDYSPTFSDYVSAYAINILAVLAAWGMGYILHAYLVKP